MVGADRHSVVVEHDEKIFRFLLGGKHRFERESVAQRRIADAADHAVVFAAQIARVAQPDARRDRRAAVPRNERVVFALERVRKTARAALLRSVSSDLPVRSLCT